MKNSILAARMAFIALSLPIVQVTSVQAGSCELTPVLIEDFDDLSIASARIGPARWTAHTPWGGDFGDARFADPGPDGPFKVQDGILSITASRESSFFTQCLLSPQRNRKKPGNYRGETRFPHGLAGAQDG